MAGYKEETKVSHSGGGTKAQKHTKFAAIPGSLMLALAEHYYDGASKYEDDENGLPNFWRGYPMTSNIEAALRHFYAWLEGERDIPQTPEGTPDDPTAGNHHLLAVIWHMIDLWMKDTGPDRDRWDDRPVTALQKFKESE